MSAVVASRVVNVTQNYLHSRMMELFSLEARAGVCQLEWRKGAPPRCLKVQVGLSLVDAICYIGDSGRQEGQAINSWFHC